MHFKPLKSLWPLASAQTKLHYAALIAILAVGAMLRFYNLELKALWLDEVITALFSLGHRFGEVPTEQFFSTDTLTDLFTFKPGISDIKIVRRVVRESTHPPLFFILMYRWMSLLQPSLNQLAWALRSLPALFGIGAIAAIYALNRVAFSPTAALWGAACMAVSPFAVYLSQEARHYMLPVLLITLALTALVQMQQDFQRQRFRPWVWLGWVVANALGLYVHYFFMLALVAQVMALVGWMLWQWRTLNGFNWMALVGAIAGIALATLPWLPVMLGHSDRPETDWLEIRNNVGGYPAPIYQTVVGWVLMVLILPVEAQPMAIAVPVGMLMMLGGGWIFWQAWLGLCDIWKTPKYRAPLFLIAGFTLAVLLEFGGIVYILGKDITVAPRYNFVYYPGVCALLGVALAGLVERSRGALQNTLQKQNWRRAPLQIPALVIAAGFLSSLLVTNNLAFVKTYDPAVSSQLMYQEPSKPVLLAIAYRSFQDIALGLSDALRLQKVAVEKQVSTPPQFIFLRPEATPPLQWGKLENLPAPLSDSGNLWLAAQPGALAEQFPLAMSLTTASGKASCPLDPQRPARVGFHYRLYRCSTPQLQRAIEGLG